MADVKIVAIFGGLGSQMFKYATYLMVKRNITLIVLLILFPVFI